MGKENKLTPTQEKVLIHILQERFEKNMHRHKNLKWAEVEWRLKAHAEKLWSLHEMERLGGEPDVVALDKKSDEYRFFDCVKESPQSRRSLCYDAAALASRKANKPAESAVAMADAMGIQILTEEDYQVLQQLEPVDTKTSSWLRTPEAVRKEGGAIFGDRRFGRVFVYHNGAESYYGGRGFRGLVKI